MKKILLILLDGIGDRIYKELGNLTPLEYANTPNLDRIAKLGASASVYPINPGMVPPSELAHFHLFGYEKDFYPGRAVFESMGFGIPPPINISVAHLGLRHVTPSNEGFMITPWWPASEAQDAQKLVESISQFESCGIHFEVQYIGKSDSLLIMHGGCEDITDSDPFMHTGRPVLEIQALDSSKNHGDAQNTAKALNHYLRWTHEVLSKHPINSQRVLDGKLPLNMTVTKWPGKHQELMSFYQKTGLTASLIASAPMYKGMASALKMNYIEVDEGDPRCEMIDKLAAAKHAFDHGCDFVHLHTKAADEAAHSHSPLNKAQVIEAIDVGLSALWGWERLQEDFLIAITADHCTPSHGPMLHSGESVPLSLMGEGVRVDSVNHFSERLSVGGSLGQLCSRDLMPILLNASNRSHFLGGRPNSYESFGITSFKAL